MDAHDQIVDQTNQNDDKMVFIRNQATLIKYHHYHFLITESPTDANLSSYISLIKETHTTIVVCFCDAIYDTHKLENELEKSEIKFFNLAFQDGQSPPNDIVRNWIDILEMQKNISHCITVHCSAGFGRAPIMVAIALIEKGCDPYDAIALIRKKRHGCFNFNQLNYIEKYQPQSKPTSCHCLIS